jgi:hypothetical protein
MGALWRARRLRPDGHRAPRLPRLSPLHDSYAIDLVSGHVYSPGMSPFSDLSPSPFSDLSPMRMVCNDETNARDDYSNDQIAGYLWSCR